MIETAILKNRDILSQVRYVNTIDINNLYDVFKIENSPNNLLESLTLLVEGMWGMPFFKLHRATDALLTSAAAIHGSAPAKDTQIGQILQVSLQEGAKCVQDAMLNVSNALMMNSGLAVEALQQVNECNGLKSIQNYGNLRFVLKYLNMDFINI